MQAQHEKSPHRYFTDACQLEKGAIVVDAGGAEGDFALSVIDIVSKIYIVECEDCWMEALQQTFAPWKEKVIFVKRFLSDKSDEYNITVDEMLDGQSIDMIKMYIEGAEKKALRGAKQTFANSKDIKAIICCYHNDEDCDVITDILKNYGCKTEVSNGYMFFEASIDNPLNSETPRLRRGVVRGKKEYDS